MEHQRKGGILEVLEGIMEGQNTCPHGIKLSK
jgi:hypothetical protein